MPQKMRWIALADYSAAAQVLASAPEPYNWSERKLREILSRGKASGQYIARGREIVGVVIYHREHTRMTILNFGVKPEFRRQGIGSEMMQTLVRRISDRIVLRVPAELLSVQLFLRKQGIRATEVLHGGDVYQFEVPPKQYRSV